MATTVARQLEGVDIAKLKALPELPNISFMAEINELSLLCMAAEIAYDVLDAHWQQQEDWPDTTDCDRPDRAFGELEQSGILVRQHYHCCRPCASGLLWKEVCAYNKAGIPVHGCAYYPERSTEDAISEKGLVLHFGAVARTAEATVAIGTELMDALQRHALTATWEGTANWLVVVEMDWKRRRPTPAELQQMQR